MQEGHADLLFSSCKQEIKFPNVKGALSVPGGKKPSYQRLGMKAKRNLYT